MSSGFENIILDLDETLIHSTQRESIEGDPSQYGCQFYEWDYITFERPHLQEFLLYLFNRYKRVLIWTAATEQYGLYIIHNILEKYVPPDKQFDLFLHSGHCDISEKEFGIKKNLQALFNVFPQDYNSDNTVIIDDHEDVKKQDNHTIQIKPFTQNDCKTDQELKKIQKQLSILYKTKREM